MTYKGEKNKMNTGKKFEALFQESCKLQGISCTRLQDAGYRGEHEPDNNKLKPKRFTISNICDFICYAQNRLLFVELKSRKSNISFKELDKQASRLLKKHNENNWFSDLLHTCGFLFEFSEAPQGSNYFYLNIIDYEDFKESIKKKSFGYKDFQWENDDFLMLVTTIIHPGKRTPRLNLLDMMKKL